MSMYPSTDRVPTGRQLVTPAYRIEGWSMGCGKTTMHMCKLKHAEELAVLWPWLKYGLLQIATKNARRTHWLPEHLRMQIAMGLAGQNQLECFLAHENENEDALHGFMIVYPLVDPFVQLPLTWFVWMANMGPRVITQLMPEFEEMGRARGYLRWQWGTTREGWVRRARRFGADVVEYTIGKEL